MVPLKSQLLLTVTFVHEESWLVLLRSKVLSKLTIIVQALVVSPDRRQTWIHPALLDYASDANCGPFFTNLSFLALRFEENIPGLSRFATIGKQSIC